MFKERYNKISLEKDLINTQLVDLTSQAKESQKFDEMLTGSSIDNQFN